MEFKLGLKENMSEQELKEWFKSFISKEIENRLNIGQGSAEYFTLIEDGITAETVTLELYSSNVVSDETKVRFTIDLYSSDTIVHELCISKWFSGKDDLDDESLEEFVQTYIKGKALRLEHLEKIKA